jgi:hypothetical protein
VFLVVNQSCTTDTWAAADRPKSEKTTAVFRGLQLHEGRLTAHVTATPLPQVLSEMSRLSGAKVVWLGQPDHRQVSVTFTALPVAEAIERVLGANNFLLVYASTADKARLKEIWISTRHSSTQTVINLVPEPPPITEEITANEIDAELAKTLESNLNTALHGADRDSRIEAIGSLGGLVEQDPRIRPLLQQLSTSEPDIQVRTAAAEMLAGLGE